MSLFGKDKKRQPEAVQETPQPKRDTAVQADENTAAALPRKSNYFDALRSEAFMNHNVVENYVEFWVALKVDPAADKWRIMHYMIHDLDKADGKFVSEAVSKQDVDFVEAVRQISMYERIAENLMTHADANMAQQYPADKNPVLKAHFYDIEYYKRAANIEGIAFDDQNKPYRRVEGKVFANATFKRSEVEASILAADQARDVPAIQAKIEGGILSDIYSTVSSRAASLDNILKIGQVLGTMDDFALQVGAFYLSVQRAVKLDDKFDRIEGLQPDEKKDVLARASGLTNVQPGDANAFPKILQGILPAMNGNLEAAKQLGVHVEPFQKFAAECELYANLLYASQNLAKLEKGFVSVNNSDTNLITEIRQSVDRAQKKFTDLGGTQEQMDKLKAWVANPKKDPIPGWLPGFLTRYYEARGRVMQKVQDRQAGLTQVNTMSVDVKPPVTDQYNSASAKPANGNALPASVQDDTPPAAGVDFDKFKNIVSTSSRPKGSGGAAP